VANELKLSVKLIFIHFLLSSALFRATNAFLY
jgi:hypothetical protein